MPALIGDVGRALAILVQRVDVGAVFNEKLNQVLAACASCPMQCREALLLMCVDISPTIQNHAHDFNIAVRNGSMNRSHFQRVLRRLIYVRACREKVLNDLFVAEERRQAKRVESIRRVSVNRFREALEQGVNAVRIAHGAGIEQVKRAPAFGKNRGDGRLAVVTGKSYERDALRSPGCEKVRIFTNQNANLGSITFLDRRLNGCQFHTRTMIPAARPGVLYTINGRFMIHLFKLRTTPFDLGHLESKVMDIIWSQGESSVRDVVARLGRPLAYTTVMTTLDRLFKKGLLDRRKEERAFFYVAQFSRTEWETKRADSLISCLVESAGSQDTALLEDLEARIRMKRMELETKRKP